jgi:parallel beta-helix repeat protein
MNKPSLLAITASLFCFVAGCPAENGNGDEGSEEGAMLPQGCNYFVEAGETSQDDLITAFVDVQPGETVCIGEGTFTLTRQATVTADGVTIRGEGPDLTVLEFSTQNSGANGILIEGDDNVIENLKVLNTPGDGIRANDVDGITFRGVHVGWDAEAAQTNGAYALYPVQSTNVTIQDVKVWGARDAGIYLGQSTNSLIENSEAYGNVIGIEVENSWDTIVRGCNAHDNTNGILVITLPGLDQLDGKRANVYDNVVENNNVPNFGDPGTTVGLLPPGVGILVVATDSNEIWNNTVRGNDSTGIAVISFTDALFEAPNDPNYDIYSESNYVHDNVISGNGLMPNVLLQALAPGQDPFPEIIHDGCFNEERENTNDALTNCMAHEGVTFYNADMCTQWGMATNDVSEFTCEQPRLPTDSPVQG